MTGFVYSKRTPTVAATVERNTNRRQSLTVTAARSPGCACPGRLRGTMLKAADIILTLRVCCSTRPMIQNGSIFGVSHAFPKPVESQRSSSPTGARQGQRGEHKGHRL